MSGRIVRYASRAALSNPYARAGYMAGRYGPAAARAAGAIARWGFRRFRARKRSFAGKRKRSNPNLGRGAKRRVGDRVGTSNAKKVATNTGSSPVNTRTLYAQNLIHITRGEDLNQRDRDIVNFRGVKICKWWRNVGDTPIFLNVAVVSRKDAPSNIPPETGDWFRDVNDNKRSQDFDPTQLSAIAFRCLGINTDKYLVIKHRRYTLGGLGDANTTAQKPNYMMLQWWIPFSRQIRYVPDEGDGYAINANLYLVWWADNLVNNPGTAAATTLNSSQHIVTYFRDTKT